MKKFLILSCMALFFAFPNTSYSQAVAGAPNLNILGSIASFNLAPPVLGVTGEINNQTNTICMISKVETQWGKVNSNNVYSAFIKFIKPTNFEANIGTITPNSKWNYTTGTTGKLLDDSWYTIGQGEKYAAKVTATYSYYLPGQMIPVSGTAFNTVVK